MTTHSPQEAPHFTKELLIDSMRHLSGDFAASVSGKADDGRVRSRLEHARRIGLNTMAGEAIAAMEEATKDVRDLVWPGGLDQRYLGLVGVVEVLARISTELLPHDEKTAHLTTLAPIMHRAMVASGSRLRAAMAQRLRGLCVVIDPATVDDTPVAVIAERGVAGGAVAIQLRSAPSDVAVAEYIRDMCKSTDAVLVIEDRADVASAVRADGVRLPEHGLPIDAARRVVDAWQIVGTSDSTALGIREAVTAGADYVALDVGGGLSELRAAREALATDGPPLIAYRGITTANAAEVARAGADGFCVTSAVTEAKDPRSAAAALVEAFEGAR